MPCPVDPTAWGKKNRVTLYPEKVNEWVLVRTSRDNPDRAYLVLTLRAVMAKWFGDYVGVGVHSAELGEVGDNVELVSYSHERPVPSPTDQTREKSTDPIPLLSPSEQPPIYLKVRFNYHGMDPSMPWPVWGVHLGTDPTCPFDCDWMLVQARVPTAERPLQGAGPPLSLSEKIEKFNREVAGAIGHVGDWAKWIALGLGAATIVHYFGPQLRGAYRQLQGGDQK